MMLKSICLPDPAASFEQSERFHHRDVSALTSDALWAEIAVLRGELAVLLFSKARPQYIHFDGTGRSTTDVGWLRARIARLSAEARRREAGA